MNKTSFDFKDGNGKVPAHRHRNGGGWVANTAGVNDLAYVNHTACVYGRAAIGKEASVFGTSRVFDDAVMYPRSTISGDSVLYGESIFDPGSKVPPGIFKNVKIPGKSRVYNYTCFIDSDPRSSDRYVFTVKGTEIGRMEFISMASLNSLIRGNFYIFDRRMKESISSSSSVFPLNVPSNISFDPVNVFLISVMLT